MNTDTRPDSSGSPELAPVSGSGEADPLVLELRSLATTDYPLCPESRLLLEMAVDAQLGKPIDVSRLIPNIVLGQQTSDSKERK